MRVSIIAHFDTVKIWDKSFLVLLDAALQVTDQAIVITTAKYMPDLPADFSGKVRLIRRPNVGYDFYSYKVGVQCALSKSDTIDGILILNSSICVLNEDIFKTALQGLVSNNTAVSGITESDQIDWHLQSYAIYFNLSILGESWVKHFFKIVEPVNEKFEIVFRYEIGLGKALKDAGLSTTTLFTPTIDERLVAAVLILKSMLRKYGWMSLLSVSTWRAMKEVNWTHFGAVSIAHKFGFAKTELLRTNPHRLDLERIFNSCSDSLKASVDNLIGRTQSLYSSSSTGLTVLKHSTDPMGIIREIITSPRHVVANSKTAAVVHLFYKDLLQEIIDDLENIIEPADIFITTPFEADLPYIFDEFGKRQKNVCVVLTKNHGRDVGPFISLFRTGRLDHYDAVLKLHSKKSKYSENGNFWRRELYGPLCGTSLAVLNSLQLIRERNIGIVGPSKYFLTNQKFWGANREQLSEILKACRVKVDSGGPDLAFFAGTMFWFSPKALKSIHLCDGDSIDFPPEDGKQDGTLAHAWERAFCLIAREHGFLTSSIESKGVDIFSTDTSANAVPVLDVA